MSADLTADALKGAPAAAGLTAGAGLQFFGIGIADLAYLLTAIYTALLIIWWIAQRVRSLFRKSSATAPPEPD